ncbi:MAG: hypothetical protein ACM3OB_03685 [Acidobacteriota bacterium]
MDRKVALAVVALAPLVVLPCLGSPALPARVALALALAALPPALVALGAVRDGRLDRVLRWACAGLFLILAAGLFALIALHERPTTFFAGTPAALLVLLGGLWGAPIVLVLWVYTARFGTFGIRGADLERLRALRRSAEDE